MADKRAIFLSVSVTVLLLVSSLAGTIGKDETRSVEKDVPDLEQSGDDTASASRDTYPFADHYPTVSEYYHWYDNLTTDYPDLCKKIDVGESWEGRTLWVLKISDNVSTDEDEPEAFFDGNIHAREWSTSQATAYFMWRLLSGYDTNDTIHWLVNNREIFVCPMFNPDGYIQDGNGDLGQADHWRKNRNDSTPTSSVGVDLNRNWDINFGGVGSSDNPSSSTYHGEAPFSEYETDNITDWMQSRDLETYHNMHSYAGTLLIPWCYTGDPSPHDTWYREMAEDMVQHTSIQGDPSDHYSYGQANEEIGYSASGGANDWGYNATGAVGLTFELQTYGNGFYPPESDIMTINQDVDDALIYQARVADIDIGTGDTNIFPPAPYLVFGTVTNETGSPATNKLVRLKNRRTGENLSVRTDGNGYYELDLGKLTDQGYTDTDEFSVIVGGSAKRFTPGSEWGQRIDIQYTEPRSMTLSLDEGWNLISSNLVPKTSSLSDILNDPSTGIKGNYTEVMAYENPIQRVTKTAWKDDFESTGGWTTEGEWEIGSPQGKGGDYGSPDPTNAVSGTNVLGYDLSGQNSNPGDYEDSMSETKWVESPPIDLTGYSNLTLEFERWLGLEKNSYDNGYIEVYDGSTWQQVWANPDTTIAESSWNHVEYDISQYADNNPNFQVRFGLGTTDSGWHYCGWNIDDLSITYETYEEVEEVNQWRTYMPDRPSHFNSLESFTPKQGYWIKMSQPDDLIIQGARLNNTSLKLRPGWNLVSYPSNTSTNNGLPTAIDRIGFHSSSAEYEIEYTSNTTGFTFEPGHAYWVHNPINRALSWDVDY